MPTLYHYTNGTHLLKILSAGFLKATPNNPKPREKKICWLSSNPSWEKTANKVLMMPDGESRLMDQADTEKYCKGLFRFVLNTDTYPGEVIGWPRLAVAARIPDKIKKRLLTRAKKAKVAPSQWFGILGELPLEHTTLEQLVDGQWHAISFDEAKPVENGMDVVSGVTMKRLPNAESDWSKI